VDPEILEAAVDALAEPIRSVNHVREGWDFDVCELNGRWIVRAPRREDALVALAREVVLLPALAEVLPVEVPRIQHVLREPRLAVVYGMLHGRRLNEELESGTDEGALGKDLGCVLAALHAFPVDRARELGVAVRDPIAEVSALAEHCAFQVFPLLEASERGRARRAFESYLGEPAPPPALHHADLGPAHVLCRAERITGVIDWTDARVGDPALDLWWLGRDRSSTFSRSLADAYEQEGLAIDESVLRRARFWYFAGPWHEVLYGLGPGDDAYIKSGLAGIRSRLP